MPPKERAEYRFRKRKRAIEGVTALAPTPTPTSTPTDPQPQSQPSAKRQKRSQRLRSRTPPEFWDNLSQVPLCRRALREFNRRTIQLPILKPPARSAIKKDLIKQLKRFARHGGPDLRNIRGYPEPEIELVHKMSSSRSRSSRPRSSQSRRTRTDPSSATSRPTTYSSKDPAFQQALIDAHIYPHGYEYSDNEDAPLPNDLDEVNERLQQSRSSLSPSQFTVEDFRRFQRSNMRATSESTVMRSVFPTILGRNTMPTGEDYPFNNLESLADNISNPRPDYFNGSRPSELHPDVKNDLGKYIIPSSDLSRPLLPNFFMEAKGPTGSAAEMRLQITQDLAAGARGMHKMQSYEQEQPVYDGNTYTVGSTYHSGTGTLQLYAMHPTPLVDPNGQPEYHTTQLDSFGLTGNPNSCRQGIAAFRNMQDWAKEQRDEFIKYANQVAAAAQLLKEVETEEEDDDDDNDDDNEEEEEEEPATLAAQYMDSFTSLSQMSTQNEYSVANNMAAIESDTSTDELARDYQPPPAKRSSKSSSYRQYRKRRTR